LLCACALMCPGAGKKQLEHYAVVAGTVFRDSGFSLPGATVTLAPKADPKAKRLQTTSDARGEFAFRVPAAPATYVVRASLKGFRLEEKEAAVGDEGRVEVTFLLTPEAK
jgi:Carboxypeptidase regulatory-like domain